MAPRKKPPAKADGDLVIVQSFVHWKTKKRVYRKDGKPFAFRVKRKAA
jgi:hypothetical protein